MKFDKMLQKINKEFLKFLLLKNNSILGCLKANFLAYFGTFWPFICCELNWVYILDFNVQRSAFKILTSFSSVQFNELYNWIERRSF